MNPPKRTAGIYQIANTINGKRYIGSAVCITARWALHLHELRRGTHHAVPLQRAVDKYGIGALSFSVLEVCPACDLITTEQRYLDTEKPEYNCSPTAGSTLGLKYTEAQRRANSVRSKKFWNTPEGQKMAGERSRKWYSDPANKEAHRQRMVMRLARTPKAVLRAKYTPEVRAKIGAAKRRGAERFMVRGKLLPATEIQAKFGIERHLFRRRLRSGWEVERAATERPEEKHTVAGAAVFKYRGKSLTIAELGQVSEWSLAAIRRRLASGLSPEQAVHMTRSEWGAWRGQKVWETRRRNGN